MQGRWGDSCPAHPTPVRLSQQCSRASPAAAHTRRNLQMRWNFSARAGSAAARTEGPRAAARASGSSSLVSPLPPCSSPMSVKGPLVSDECGTRRSRKPLRRARQPPKRFVLLKCFSDYKKLIYKSLLNAATFTKCFASPNSFYSLQRHLQPKTCLPLRRGLHSRRTPVTPLAPRELQDSSVVKPMLSVT